MFKFLRWFKANKTLPAKDCAFFENKENDILISVKRVDYRMFYDSEWIVDVTVFEHNKTNIIRRFSCNIIRCDDEDASRLEQLVRALGPNLDVTSIKALDERKCIFYD